MNPSSIQQKLLDGIRQLGGMQLRYLSGKNFLTQVRVDDKNRRITALRGGNKSVSVPFDQIALVAELFAKGERINLNSGLNDRGNSRSAFEAMLAHLPNVGFLRANSPLNDGPKRVVWFDQEIHPLGEVRDASDLLESEPVSAQTNSGLESIVEDLVADADASGIRSNDGNVRAFIAALLAKRFLILTGLAGSGKTKLAQVFARWITPAQVSSSPFHPGNKINSDRISYYVRAADDLAVEFWNSENDENAIKVVLPLGLIEEWADHIQQNDLPPQTSARTIREAVKTQSKYSDRLHSFETQLKAAAYALLAGRRKGLAIKAYEVIPVGADWTGSEFILGYPDGLRPPNGGNLGGYVSKPPLDLILRAKENPDVPHFLILDEMNLSHVERYFADLLSMIESDESITLYCDEKDNYGKPKNSRGIDPVLRLPQNVFVIGTVNVDETTYMFSPKVLDRANVIEFRVTPADMRSFIATDLRFPDLQGIDGKGARFSKTFVESATRNKTKTDQSEPVVPIEVKARYERDMELFFMILHEHGAEFGYRVAHEAARFVHFYKLLSDSEASDTSDEFSLNETSQSGVRRDWFDDAFDAVIIQKFLPKLHGSKVKLGQLLRKLYTVCAEPPSPDVVEAAQRAARINDSRLSQELLDPAKEIPELARYPKSAEKIFRMWRQLNENGFTSFAEN